VLTASPRACVGPLIAPPLAIPFGSTGSKHCEAPDAVFERATAWMETRERLEPWKMGKTATSMRPCRKAHGDIRVQPNATGHIVRAGIRDNAPHSVNAFKFVYRLLRSTKNYRFTEMTIWRPTWRT
jgi:hypothetical protein